jgi:hypothetical protein
VLDSVYRAVAWQRVDQIRYNIFKSNKTGVLEVDILTAVAMESYVTWDITLCTPVKVN